MIRLGGGKCFWMNYYFIVSSANSPASIANIWSALIKQKSVYFWTLVGYIYELKSSSSPTVTALFYGIRSGGTITFSSEWLKFYFSMIFFSRIELSKMIVSLKLLWKYINAILDEAI